MRRLYRELAIISPRAFRTDVAVAVAGAVLGAWTMLLALA